MNINPSPWGGRLLLIGLAVVGAAGWYCYSPPSTNEYLASCLAKKQCRIVRYEYISNDGSGVDGAIPQAIIDQTKPLVQREPHVGVDGVTTWRTCSAFVLPPPMVIPAPPEFTERETKSADIIQDRLMGYIERLLDSISSRRGMFEKAYQAYLDSCNTITTGSGSPPLPALPKPSAEKTLASAPTSDAGYNPLTMPVDAGLSSSTGTSH